MIDFALFNFIFYNFRQTLLTCGLIFHCWETPALKIFAQLATNEGFYMQYVNIGNASSMYFQPHLKGQFFKRDRPVLGVFLDLNCAQSSFILNESSSHHIFNEHFHWVLYEQSGDSEPFRQFAEGVNFYVSSDVTYVLAEQSFDRLIGNGTNEKRFTLYDVYNNGPMIGGKLNITIDRSIICSDIECNLDQYLSLLHKRLKFANRNSQRDVTMRIATVVILPSNPPTSEKLKFLYSINNTDVDSIMRFGFQQAMLLMDTLYVKYKFIFFDTWAVGELTGGSLITILDGRSDLSSTPFTMTITRLKYFQIIAETAPFNSICLFRTPRNTGLLGSGKAFLDPFTPPVWIAFGIILLISAIQLWAIFFVEFNRMPNELNHAPSLLTSCLLSLGTACVQGSYVLPGSVGGRATYAVIALATFIMYNYYTSVIVSTLLGSSAKSGIKTIAQVADSAMEVGFQARPWISAYLNSSQLPAMRQLVKKKIENRKNPMTAWVSITDGLLRTRDEIGTFAYVFEASSGFGLVEKYYKPEEICDLNEIKFRPDTSMMNSLPKNSSFKELFRLRFMRMVETGVNRRMTKYWLRTRLNCFASNIVVKVSLGYTASLFFFLLLFFFISLIVLFFEIICNFFDKRKSKVVSNLRMDRNFSTRPKSSLQNSRD